MKLPSNIRFVNETIKDKLYALNKGTTSEKELYKLIHTALDCIEENAFCGIQIPKKLIPKEYFLKYNIQNLWKYNLPKGWRLMYSVVNDEIVVVSLVLEWFNHKDYERRFNY